MNVWGQLNGYNNVSNACIVFDNRLFFFVTYIINNLFKNLNLLNKYLSLLDKKIIFFSANNDENTLITKSIE